MTNLQPAPVAKHDVVFLLDVDNTLLDNDAVYDDLRSHIRATFGSDAQQRYWDIFEQLRTELGYADYLGALQRYRVEHFRDPGLLEISLFLVDYPFADRLYPGVFEVLAHLRRAGPTVILSDGDVVFQPRKVARSGLWEAVDGRVLIYIHKEQMLDDVQARFPANHYVMVDDKIRILTAMKAHWGEMLTTVFPRQGHYAHDRAEVDAYPPADLTVEQISELAALPLDKLSGISKSSHGP